MVMESWNGMPRMKWNVTWNVATMEQPCNKYHGPSCHGQLPPCHHRTCQHVNMSSKCHALCQAVLVPNNVRPQQNVQVSHLLMNLTWQSIRQQVLCNDNDMTWQSISAAVQWQWHDMTIYQTWNDNDNWKSCSGWDWRCFQPGQPRSQSWKGHACHERGPWKWDVLPWMPWICTQPFCMPWMRSMNVTCMPWMP